MTNTAVVTAAEPDGDEVAAKDDETVTSTAASGIEFTKSASPLTYVAGDVVTYTFTTKNTGQLTLKGVDVKDTGLSGLSALDCTPAAPADLSPGESMTCKATKTITQDEADAGSVTNTAQVTATEPDGDPVSAKDDETVTSTAASGIDFTKSASPSTYVAGDVVTYTFTTKNTGQLTLKGVDVKDTGLSGLSALDCTPAAPADLSPGESLTCKATKTMTQDEADAGSVTNTALVTAAEPDGDEVAAKDDETVTSTAASGIEFTKSASPSTYVAGDVVTYTFTTKNTGQLTLKGEEHRPVDPEGG